MMQAIEKQALFPAHIAFGIELVELDDHILVLQCKGETIAVYSATGVAVEQIQKDATAYMLYMEKHA